MEMDSAKDQPPVSKQRYPLRSASKLREEKVAGGVISGSSSRKGSPPSVSKSISALELSGKDKTPKPPRRLSIPSSSSARSATTVTPNPKHHLKRQDHQAKINTSASDLSKSVSKKKFNALSSVSYWLSQIKLSESASKHSISLGFFKLALESECEPLQRVREELKSYATRHKILELGEPAREVLRSYNILEEAEALTAPVLERSKTAADVIDQRKTLKPSIKKNISRDGSSAPEAHKPRKVNAPETNLKGSVPEENKENADNELVETM